MLHARPHNSIETANSSDQMRNSLLPQQSTAQSPVSSKKDLNTLWLLELLVRPA